MESLPQLKKIYYGIEKQLYNTSAYNCIELDREWFINVSKINFNWINLSGNEQKEYQG